MYTLFSSSSCFCRRIILNLRWLVLGRCPKINCTVSFFVKKKRHRTAPPIIYSHQPSSWTKAHPDLFFPHHEPIKLTFSRLLHWAFASFLFVVSAYHKYSETICGRPLCHYDTRGARARVSEPTVFFIGGKSADSILLVGLSHGPV